MKRRTVLKRLGAVGAVTAGIATSTASAKPFDGLDRSLDVSDVSGTVTLGSLVDGDVEAYVNDEFQAQIPESVDLADITIQVDADTDEIGPTYIEPECPVWICCPGTCPCDWCYCKSWGCD